MKLIYINSSQFSGTTLLSFLLNNHSQIATIGHTTGWKYASYEDFRCSCGERIRNCSLFRQVANDFNKNGLAFDPTDFGTAFQLSNIDRINQLLTGPVPGIRSTRAEELRDRIVDIVPALRRKLAHQEKANKVLMSTVLEHSNAQVYVDNSHSPYRLKRLARGVAASVFPVHLVRDPRGVTLSMVTNSGFSVEDAIESWLRHQQNIARICATIGPFLTVQYEDLCRQPNENLAKIHQWVGVPVEEFTGNFKASEHHILGNRMRNTSSEIRLDERWRDDLGGEDQRTVERHLVTFCRRQPGSALARIIENYLNDRVYSNIRANAVP